MTKYYITETEDNGFGREWEIEAKSLTTAKRLASRAQGQVNTTLSIYVLLNDEYYPVSKKGPLERSESKWIDFE